ncbi:MAG: hypothetical protein K6U74_20895, partial [Firmicutes bacterium]|nr:hypothetical protein [Bacillota bacterium]
MVFSRRLLSRMDFFTRPKRIPEATSDAMRCILKHFMEEADRLLKDVVVVSAVRTAIGDFGGGFKGMLPHQLVVPVLQEALERAGVGGNMVNDVILGCCA